MKARYRGSTLGLLWSFINPLLLLSIYTFVFTTVMPGARSAGIELAAATAATQRASDEDLDSLEQLIDEQARQLQENPGQAWEPLVFELALIELTGNSWLYEVEVMLRDAWLSLSGGLRASVGRHGEWLSEHHAILASMRSRNVLQVQRLVIAHLSLERFEEDLHSPNRGTSRGPKASRKGRERTRR